MPGPWPLRPFGVPFTTFPLLDPFTVKARLVLRPKASVRELQVLLLSPFCHSCDHGEAANLHVHLKVGLTLPYFPNRRLAAEAGLDGPHLVTLHLQLHRPLHVLDEPIADNLFRTIIGADRLRHGWRFAGVYSILGLSEHNPSTQMAEQRVCRQNMSPIRTTSQTIKENRQPGLAIISPGLRPSLPGPLILSTCL